MKKNKFRFHSFKPGVWYRDARHLLVGVQGLESRLVKQVDSIAGKVAELAAAQSGSQQQPVDDSAATSEAPHEAVGAVLESDKGMRQRKQQGWDDNKQAAYDRMQVSQ